MTVHCGLTLQSLGHVRSQGRVLGIVSRGGAFLAEWMTRRGAENPLYADYDRLLEIARRHDLVLSLGDALRPGCLADATDRAQVQELVTLGELVRRAREAGVQAMVEGPGHMSMEQIQANVLLEKRLCEGAPFYVLGPLVTDCAPGYDHITAAIGGALAAWAGADFLCYVTPAEHLGLPGLEDVRQGVIASRIAAHAADLARGNAGRPGARPRVLPLPPGAGLGGPGAARDRPRDRRGPPRQRRAAERRRLHDVRALLLDQGHARGARDRARKKQPKSRARTPAAVAAAASGLGGGLAAGRRGSRRRSRPGLTRPSFSRAASS